MIVGLNNDMSVVSGSDWVLLTFYEGDSYLNQCSQSNRKANIMISCPASGQTSGKLSVIREERDDNSHECYNLLELFDQNLCITSIWAKFGFSVFILFILFFGLYFGVGILLNRCNGAQGIF